MAFTQGVIGGLAAGQRFAESAGTSEARRQRQMSEQQQARKQEVETAIDDVAKTAKELNEQFSIQRAAAPSAEDQAKIDQQYGQMFDSIQSQVSRVATEAAESGVPVDPQIELSKLMAVGKLRDLRAEQVVEAAGAGRKAGAEATGKLTAQTGITPFKGGKEFVDKTTGETVILTESGEVVPVGQLEKPTTKQEIRTGELGARARGEVEVGLVKGSERLARLENVQKRFKPEFLQVPTRLKAALLKGFEKVGGELNEEDKQLVTEVTNFFGDARININQTIQDITGAAMGVQEAKRIRLPEPDVGEGVFAGQSPTEFKANIDRSILNIRMAQARQTKLLKEGFITNDEIANRTAGDKSASILSIDEMTSQYDSRGEELFNQIKRANPEMNENQAFREAQNRLNEEFGL